MTDHLHVFMQTSPFGSKFQSSGANGSFPESTNDTGEIVSLVVRLGEQMWREGLRYSKAGVVTSELRPAWEGQRSLWSSPDRERRDKAWSTADAINAMLGRDAVRVLSAGTKKAGWQLRADYRSPRWTTRWDELPQVRAK